MGTSTKYPGPRGGQWTKANIRLGRWVSDIDRSAAEGSSHNGRNPLLSEKVIDESGEKALILANQYRKALADTVNDDPAAFGLRDSLRTAGDQLVRTLESLQSGTADWFSAEAESAQTPEESFVRSFVMQVTGSGDLVTNASVRQAAVTCAQKLIKAEGPLKEAIEEGKPLRGTGISGELFCFIFQVFFKDALTHFITTIVAGKVRLAFPALHLIDPAGKIADWVGQQVGALIPNPCEKGAGLTSQPTLGDLARGLVNESVDRALGIPTADSGGATP